MAFMPSFSQASKKLTAPYILPWSVMASAGMPRALAFLAATAIFVAPSKILYSVWTCKCTKFPIVS